MKPGTTKVSLKTFQSTPKSGDGIKKIVEIFTLLSAENFPTQMHMNKGRLNNYHTVKDNTCSESKISH